MQKLKMVQVIYIYSIVDESEIKSAFSRGTTLGKKRILVPDNASSVKVGSHEIGHTLGLDDGSGIMGGGEDTNVNQWHVQEIIEFAEKTKKLYPSNNRFTIHGNVPKGKRKNKVKSNNPSIKRYHE